jgi:hypothetical protein
LCGARNSTWIASVMVAVKEEQALVNSGNQLKTPGN